MLHSVVYSTLTHLNACHGNRCGRAATYSRASAIIKDKLSRAGTATVSCVGAPAVINAFKVRAQRHSWLFVSNQNSRRCLDIMPAHPPWLRHSKRPLTQAMMTARMWMLSGRGALRLRASDSKEGEGDAQAAAGERADFLVVPSQVHKTRK